MNCSVGHRVIARGRLTSKVSVTLYALELDPTKLHWVATLDPIVGVAVKSLQFSGYLVVTTDSCGTGEELSDTILKQLTSAVDNQYAEILKGVDNGTPFMC